MSTTINLHEPPPRFDAKAFLNYQIAVMQAYADGKPVEFVGRAAIAYSDCVWSRCASLEACKEGLNFEWSVYTFRVTPPKLAAGHNPSDLTEEQVGVKDGWRLLTQEEVIHTTGGPRVEIQLRTGKSSGHPWRPSGDYSQIGVQFEWTYRTKQPVGFFLPKPKVAAGFNPHSVTEQQVEVSKGYRLLSREERVHLGEKYSPGNNLSTPVAELFELEVTRFPIGSNVWLHNAIKGVWPIDRPEFIYRTTKPVGFYLPKEKKLVPWTFDTAPRTLTWLRRKAQPNARWEILSSLSGHEDDLLRINGVPAEELQKSWEHSLDGGKTWLPCGTLE